MAEIAGWTYLFYDELGSTNDEALKFCKTSEQKILVRAKTQTAGRGRRGRKWISSAGNLFFSLVFEYDIKNLGLLVLISALSVVQTIEKIAPNTNIKLKWPNDVLLNGAKLSGILLEKGENNYMVVGIGINITSSPKDADLLYKTTSLSEENITCSSDDFLEKFLVEFNYNLGFIEKNKKNILRQEWLKRAAGLGKEIIIRQENTTLTGIFSGIDDDMSLLLKQEDKISKIMVGDLFFLRG